MEKNSSNSPNTWIKLEGKQTSDPGSCSFIFLQYSPPDSSVLLLSESCREASPTFFCFVLLLHNVIETLTFDSLYVKNQMVVFLHYVLISLLFLLIEKKICLLWRDQIINEDHIKACLMMKCGIVTTDIPAVLELVWTADVPFMKKKKKASR